MGKGVDVWDDSALINAFDEAMNAYKVMHVGSFQHDDEEKNEELDISNDQSVSEKSKRVLEPKNDCNNTSGYTSEVVKPCINKEAALDVLTEQAPHPTTDSHSYDHQRSPLDASSLCTLQNSEEYNQLLNQYYALEEQKAKVLQQLYKSSHSNDQVKIPNSASIAYPACEYNTTGCSYQPNILSSQGCYLSAQPCHLLPAPLCPFSYSTDSLFPTGSICCPLVMPCCSEALPHPFTVDSLNQRAFDGAFHEEPEANQSLNVDVCGGEEAKDADPSRLNGKQKALLGTAPDNDLAVVLNSWYTAGFHTGRYLLEHSRKKPSK